MDPNDFRRRHRCGMIAFAFQVVVTLFACEASLCMPFRAYGLSVESCIELVLDEMPFSGAVETIFAPDTKTDDGYHSYSFHPEMKHHASAEAIVRAYSVKRPLSPSHGNSRCFSLVRRKIPRGDDRSADDDPFPTL